MHGRNRKRLVIAALAGLVVYLSWVIAFPGRAFDPAAWQDEASIREGARLGMADRLIVRRTLHGKTRAELVKLLGEPPPTCYFDEWDRVYWVGRERGFISIDSEWLVVRQGDDGRVTKCRLARD